MEINEIEVRVLQLEKDNKRLTEMFGKIMDLMILRQKCEDISNLEVKKIRPDYLG